MTPDAWVAGLLAAIAAPEIAAKAAALRALAPPPDGASWLVPAPPPRPGRPSHYREAQSPPRRRRTLRHGPTRLRFLLAIHHIEFSAIDLAALSCLRGAGMPAAFHVDHLAVALEEATHAGLLADLLRSRGVEPGSEPVHHRLWDAARAAGDLGEHLVVVARFLEARGLDVGADVQPRLAEVDPEVGAAIARIHRDEIGHVAIGTRWHRAWCAERGLDPLAHFAAALVRHCRDQVPGPLALDRPGRLAAGFSEDELRLLAAPLPDPGDAHADSV